MSNIERRYVLSGYQLQQYNAALRERNKALITADSLPQGSMSAARTKLLAWMLNNEARELVYGEQA